MHFEDRQEAHSAGAESPLPAKRTRTATAKAMLAAANEGQVYVQPYLLPDTSSLSLTKMCLS